MTSFHTFDEPPLECLVPGEWLSLPAGRCLRVEKIVSLGTCHGGQRLRDIDAIPTTVWAGLLQDGRSSEFDLRRAVFVDTETTGLGRGAGTYCFLVGLGTIEDDRLSVRQYFMPDFSEEEALLGLLADELSGRPGLVSFNGRAFDWPLIETRYLLARRSTPHPGEPHLDLLSVARRLWRRTLTSCALSALERDVLGVERTEEDVPSYVIPQLYLDYVQRGRTRPIAGVFYHNAMDVLSMVALAARIGRMVVASPDEADRRDHISLARLHVRQGALDRAEMTYRAALRGSRGEDARVASRELAHMLKRQGRFDEAMALWWAALEGDAAYPYVELAKQCEHRLRDRVTAYELVRRALDRVLNGSLVPQGPDESVPALQHRLSRLERSVVRSDALNRAKGSRRERGSARGDD